MRMRSMKCGDSINPGTLCWMQIIFWTVRFSFWNNLSCFFSLFLLMPLFFEHWEILFSHLSAPRTTLSLVYTSRKLRPSPALLHPARKNQDDKTPMPRRASASAVLWLRSEHAFGIFLPRFIHHQLRLHLFCSQFVHKNQDSHKPCI